MSKEFGDRLKRYMKRGDQLESIKMILQMTPSDVEKTKSIIELLSKIIREIKNKE